MLSFTPWTGPKKTMQKELVTIGQSFAFLTHDLKNMLEGLEGGAYVVDEGLKDQDLELTTRGWQIVIKNVAEISRVTQDVLYSSKKRMPKFQSVKPGVVAHQALELFHEKAGTLEIQLIRRLYPSLRYTTMDSPSNLLNSY
jgi:nitrogen-specific signal transduction histidine kinase